jgi:hypothetical protein
MSDLTEEIRGQVAPGTPAALVEAMAAQLRTMREARQLIEADGVMVRDGKQNPIEHPCLAVERAAQKALNELMRPWLRRGGAA